MEGYTLGRDFPRFSGQAEHALDDKGRLVVPARFRERLGPGFVLTVAPDRCLLLYPAVTWEAFCERLEAAPVKDDRYRRFVRQLFAHTEDGQQCDDQGRLLIPRRLREYAGIERGVTSIGSLTRIEIWATERLGELRPGDDEAAAFANELGLY